MLYHTETTGPSVEDFQTAFAKAIGIAIENDLNEILIFVHGKTNLDGVVSDAIGGIADKLQKPGGTVNIEGITIYLETEKVRSPFRRGIIIAAHLSTKLLNMTDPRATDLVYVPWSPEELDDYLSNNISKGI